MRRPTTLLFLLLLAGCTEATQQPTTPTAASPPRSSRASTAPAREVSSKAVPIPDSLVPQIQRVETIGKKIFAHDTWAAVATDVALERGMLKKGKVGGWVVEEVGEGAVVHFFTPDELPTSLIRVTFPGKGPQGASIEESSKPLSADMLSATKARRAGLGAQFPVMAKRYNTVVLPASLMGKEGWLVYMLAATTSNNEMILGGHSRILVSREGEVKEVFPLSKSIIITKRSDIPADAEGASLFTTHLVTPYPVETHVFSSMLYKMDIAVAAGEALWTVHPTGKIEYYGTH